MQWVTDLLQHDGQHVRHELACKGKAGAGWAGRVVIDGRDWCDVVRSRLGWTGDAVSPVPMPRPRLVPGSTVAYRTSGSGGVEAHQVEIGCVMGITGDVARVMRAELGRRRSNIGLPAGGGVVDELCVSGCGWRLLDTAEQNNGRVLDWLQSERVRPFAIDVRSSDAHVQLRSAILEVKFDEIHSLPAATERTALRAQLEGLNLGCHCGSRPRSIMFLGRGSRWSS